MFPGQVLGDPALAGEKQQVAAAAGADRAQSGDRSSSGILSFEANELWPAFSR